MGWGKKETPGEKLQRERDQRRAAEDHKARQRAAKTEDKSAPSHYHQSDGKGGVHSRRAERHHGDD